MDEQIDITKFRYVLYARKSTTDETRQVRSIPDQIDDCKKLSLRLGLNLVTTLKETKSAKKPNQRPIFSQMLDDIKKAKYNAILAWNPDRLARNMMEGGLIINLIDEGIIKDLKFVTHYFTHDANGKMLLGMAFVLSKQYSDELSQKVTRGVRKSFLEGKSPAPKHGYIRDEAGLYRPDEKNFELICEAWEMRRRGESLEKIADYMNKKDYGRIIKRSGKLIKMSPKILTDLFKDPFYYGVLIQAGQTVDLRQLYDFEPATTEEVYNEVQQLSHRRLRPFNIRRRKAFYPLKAIVRCFYCGRNMYVAPSTSHTQRRYLYYRCDTPDCQRKKKSIRAKVIFDFIYMFLENNFRLTEEDYKRYYQRLTELTDEKRAKLKVELHSREGSLKSVESEIKDRALKIVNIDPKSRVRDINEKRIAELALQEEQLKREIDELRNQLTDPEKDRLSFEQFLNLSKQADVIVKSADVVKKDAICRLIFLNLDVDEEKVADYRLKPPFDTMLKTLNLPPSRGNGI